MAVRWIDVSMPLQPETVVWPGDPPFELLPENRIRDGAGSNSSRLCLSTHTGTHIDAPWHFIENGIRLDQIDTGLFFGKATLLEMGDAPIVTAASLGPGPLPERLLIKTRNSGISFKQPFTETYTALAADAARRIADEHVRLVGIDYLSIGPFEEHGQDTHRILLGGNIPVVEGLRLGGLRPGAYEFVVLPLPVAGADGAPCRAFVGLED